MAKTMTKRSSSSSGSNVLGQDLEDEAVVAFQKHWADVLCRAEKGKPLGSKLWRCFEADTNERSQALSAEFFGAAHAQKMCRLTPRQISQRLSCYLPRAIESAIADFDDPKEQRTFIRELVTGIYVIFDSNQCTWPEAYDEHFEGLSIATYPGAGLYEDWVERSIGSSFFTCGTILLMKSTGEDFSKKEFDWLERGIQWNLDSDGPDVLYGLECELLTPSKIWIKIYIIERGSYVESVMAEARKIVGAKLRAFVEKAADLLARECRFDPGGRPKAAPRRKKYVPVPKAETDRFKKRFFGDVQMLPDEQVLEKLGRLLVNRNVYDETVRGVERILNGILGQELRDYHCGVNY